MKTIYKIKKQLALTLVFVAAVSGVVGSLALPQVAYAWCDNRSLDGYGDVCISQNYDNLPQAVKNQLGGSTDSSKGRENYVKLIDSCMNGDAGGGDLGIDGGGCADAAASCISKIQSTDYAKYCNGEVLANMVGGTQVLNNNCNGGKLTSSGNDNCWPLEDANQAVINDAKQAVKDRCTGLKGDTETAKTNERDKCTSAIDKCSGPALNDNGTIKNDSDMGTYTSCMNNALRNSASSQQDCTGRGGIWVDKANEGNGVAEGCKNGYSDLTNPQACAASDASGKATGAWAQAQDGSWGCHSPDEVCNKPDQWKINDQRPCTQENINKAEQDKPEDAYAAGPDGDSIEVDGQCGGARTNIISCEGMGGEALGGVLRIAILVLTTLIGIAATGGLAWASIKYAQARDNAGDTAEAKTLIRNIVIGLVLYVFLMAIVNFLVPGGMLK